MVTTSGHLRDLGKVTSAANLAGKPGPPLKTTTRGPEINIAGDKGGDMDPRSSQEAGFMPDPERRVVWSRLGEKGFPDPNVRLSCSRKGRA